MIVEVEQVMRFDIDVPVDRRRCAIKLDEAVGIVIVPEPARRVWMAWQTRIRRRVGNTQIEIAIGIDGRRVPQAATGIDSRIPPQVVGRGVEVPEHGAGGDVESVHDPPLSTAVEVVGVAWNRAYDHGAVLDEGRHVLNFTKRTLDARSPDFFPSIRLDRDNVT